MYFNKIGLYKQLGNLEMPTWSQLIKKAVFKDGNVSLKGLLS